MLAPGRDWSTFLTIGGDALYAAARLCEILVSSGKPPAEVFAEGLESFLQTHGLAVGHGQGTRQLLALGTRLWLEALAARALAASIIFAITFFVKYF